MRGERAIVCVDDEAIQLLALKRELGIRFGKRYLIEVAADGERALDLLEGLSAEGIDVPFLITDWLMPGIRGDELIKLARARFPRVRAIMITGQADEEAKRRCVEEGGVLGILGKPWRRDDLIATIESAEAG
jgi:CheY-like chemotaxis protein